MGADDGNLGWGVRKRRNRGGSKITSETWGRIETTETRGGLHYDSSLVAPNELKTASLSPESSRRMSDRSHPSGESTLSTALTSCVS